MEFSLLTLASGRKILLATRGVLILVARGAENGKAMFRANNATVKTVLLLLLLLCLCLNPDARRATFLLSAVSDGRKVMVAELLDRGGVSDCTGVTGSFSGRLTHCTRRLFDALCVWYLMVIDVA